MGFGPGQPSPFYLHALPSPLGGQSSGGAVGGGVSANLTNSAYALLNSFFSPQRTTAPTLGSLPEVVEVADRSDAIDADSTRGAAAGTSRNSTNTRKRSALSTATRTVAQKSTANARTEEGDADEAPPAKLARRQSQSRLPLDDDAPPADSGRMVNRRFSSGTPLASPGRLSARRSSKDLLFDYTPAPRRPECESATGSTTASALHADGAAATRVTSSVECTDATPL